MVIVREAGDDSWRGLGRTWGGSRGSAAGTTSCGWYHELQLEHEGAGGWRRQGASTAAGEGVLECVHAVPRAGV